MFQSEDYEPITNLETELLLTEMPLEVIKENLKVQINNPLSTRVNFLEPMLDKFRVIQDELGDNPEAMQELKSIRVNLFGFLIDALNDAYDLDVEYDPDNGGETQTIGYALYTFLILRYKKNITRFLYKYIKRNKKSLAQEFESYQKKKDVSSLTIKKKIKDKNTILIISNLPEIINYVINLEVSAPDFFEYLDDDDLFEVQTIQQLMNSGKMSDSFIDKYIDVSTDINDFILDDIQSDIRLKLINKN